MNWMQGTFGVGYETMQDEDQPTPSEESIQEPNIDESVDDDPKETVHDSQIARVLVFRFYMLECDQGLCSLA